jgi:dipeptidyl aminopeptidase/acylaminoacyl peptidase
MKRICLPLLLLLSVLGFAGTKKITVEDSLAIHRVAAPKFSPDGNWILYTETEWDRKNDRQVSHIYVSRSGGGLASVKLTNGEKGETSPQWSPDGSRIAFLADRTTGEPTAGTRGPGNQIWLIRPDGGEAEKLTSEETAISEFRWAPDGKHIAFVTRDTPKDKADREKRKKDKFDAILVDADYTYAHLWTLEVSSKSKKRVTDGAFSVSQIRWSPNGKSIAYSQSSMGTQESSFFDLNADRNSDIYVVASDGGTPKKLTTNVGPDTNPEWSPDGNEISYVSAMNANTWADKSDIMVLAAAGGTPRNLTRDFPDSASDPKWSPDGKNVYWSSEEGVRRHIFRVAVNGGKAVHITEGGAMYADFDLSPDGNRIVCTIDNSIAPPEVWIISANGNAAGRVKISNANAAFDEFAVAKSEVVRWKGPDNFDVEGWITYPLDYQAGKKVPLILSIHGGPYGANTARFDARAQIFAAHGYAVLAPNPRGSTGYGMKFEQANVSDWGGKDFGDLMAGVDAMIDRGIADKDKLVVMGGSYGGFMTFWTVTQTNRFKAAIGHAGISDWYSFYGQSDIPGLMTYGFGGEPWKATQTFRKYSPITYISQVKTPIMITHGEQDRRVPIQQAEEFYRGVKGVGDEAIFVRYPREGHGITEPNHQIDLVGRQLEWFEKHLK